MKHSQESAGRRGACGERGAGPGSGMPVSAPFAASAAENDVPVPACPVQVMRGGN